MTNLGTIHSWGSAAKLFLAHTDQWTGKFIGQTIKVEAFLHLVTCLQTTQHKINQHQPKNSCKHGPQGVTSMSTVEAVMYPTQDCLDSTHACNSQRPMHASQLISDQFCCLPVFIGELQLFSNFRTSFTHTYVRVPGRRDWSKTETLLFYILLLLYIYIHI